MFRFITAALALFMIPICGSATQNITNFTLDNGMQVVVIEDHRSPVAVHMVWYKVGSADEVAGTSGIAHYLEHLMFKATDTLAAGELSQIVAANGGADNAFTSYDYTAYFQRVSSDRLETMMQMEADRMVNLRLVEDDIASERSVVIEERNQRTDNSPSALFSEQKYRTLYMNHGYGVPIIGWKHEMENLSLHDAVSFYKQHYGPNNAVLVVAGDVVPQDVKAMAEKHYGVIPKNPAILERNRPQEPIHRTARRFTMHDIRVAQPYVSRSYLAPERNSGDQKMAAALVYLAELLGGASVTSELAQALQFDTQTAVYTAAYYNGVSLDKTTFDLVVVPAQGVSLEQVERAMDLEIAHFIENGVDQAAFERIKTQIRASEIYALDSVQGQAQRYGAGLTSGLTLSDVQDWPMVLQNVTPEDVMNAAKIVFNEKQSVTGWLMGPKEDTQ